MIKLYNKYLDESNKSKKLYEEIFTFTQKNKYKKDPHSSSDH